MRIRPELNKRPWTVMIGDAGVAKVVDSLYLIWIRMAARKFLASLW